MSSINPGLDFCYRFVLCLVIVVLIDTFLGDPYAGIAGG